MTPYDDVNDLLGALVSTHRTLFGDRLVGMYLYGSLVTGGFDPGCSDVDVLCALVADVTDAEVAALAFVHDEIAAAFPYWAGRVEVNYVSVAALRTFRTTRHRMANISPGEPLHVIEGGADWLTNWYAVREYGRALLGPPPGEIIDPIAPAEFVRAVRDHVATAWDDWFASDGGRLRQSQAYAILTLCRGLYSVAHGGKIASKNEAAAWAANTSPEWARLIQNAVDWRESYRDPVTDAEADALLPETQRFVRYAAARLTPR